MILEMSGGGLDFILGIIFFYLINLLIIWFILLIWDLEFFVELGRVIFGFLLFLENIYYVF